MTVYLLYSATNRDNLRDRLGHAEYSYFFVREQFRTMLEKRATVIVVSDPKREVDSIYDAMRREGRACVFLPFCAPHLLPRNIRCPTVPVFAWEFDTIPDELWDDDPSNDWRAVLSGVSGAITHSQYGARAVTSAMGKHFPVEWLPAPVWDDYFSAEGVSARSVPAVATELAVTGTIVDSNPPSAPAPPSLSAPKRNFRWRLMATTKYALAWYRDVVRDLLPAVVKTFASRVGGVLHRCVDRHRKLKQAPRPSGGKPFPLEFDGYVFLTVLNPYDGRKNWQDMVTAFCTGLRHCADATLILKFTHVDSSFAMDDVRSLLKKLPPFQCRVVAVDEFLDASRYRKLVAASTFAVNSSLAEGQCLPLMEAMSCGVPVIAPQHTGMSDYVDDQVGFVVRSSQEPCCWPHDTRWVFRARRYRIDWQSMVEGYRDAYRLAKEQPDRYRQICAAAAARMQGYCSEAHVYEKLQGFIEQNVPRPRPASEPVSLRDRQAPAPGRMAEDWAGQVVFVSEALDLTRAKLAG
jgi:glycosyltransferase involved in cell wall biosynthesis